MTKIVCDICGKEIPTIKFIDFNKEIKNINFCISSLGKMWDICDECQTDFNRWVTIRRKKDKKECPHEAENDNKTMTYGDIYWEFCRKFTNAEVEDYRPASEMYMPQLAKDIPNAIIMWLKDGSKIIYISEREKDDHNKV